MSRVPGSRLQSRPLTAGAVAALRWLEGLGLEPKRRWHVTASIAGSQRARFELKVYPEEWGVRFTHRGQESWIRWTDIPFVHGRDDHGLLARVPDLLALRDLLAHLESRYGIALRGRKVHVRSNVAGAAAAVRSWLGG